mmetsp:Transcript_10341/g.17737  ORF Transcript_10341/g.17737 Transcript_10341/m.17737 type:complete len:274 (+) Transcript_10341:1614-2435(+)
MPLGSQVSRRCPLLAEQAIVILPVILSLSDNVLLALLLQSFPAGFFIFLLGRHPHGFPWIRHAHLVLLCPQVLLVGPLVAGEAKYSLPSTVAPYLIKPHPVCAIWGFCQSSRSFDQSLTAGCAAGLIVILRSTCMPIFAERICLQPRVPLRPDLISGMHLLRSSTTKPQGCKPHTASPLYPLVSFARDLHRIPPIRAHFPLCCPQDAISKEWYKAHVVISLMGRTILVHVNTRCPVQHAFTSVTISTLNKSTIVKDRIKGLKLAAVPCPFPLG